MAHSPTFAAASLQGMAVRAPAWEAQEEEETADSREELPFAFVECETAMELAEALLAFETACTEVTISVIFVSNTRPP